MRERAATFTPVEGRVVQDGDFVQVKLHGTPEGEGEPLDAESVLCHVGAEETMAPFNENLRGANVGDHKDFDVVYPADYPDAKLAGKTFHYAVDVLGIKTKTLPELNDEFAKDVSDATTLDELKKKVREGLEHERDHRVKDLQREKVLAELVKQHDFPVPNRLSSIKWMCAWSGSPLSCAAGRRSPRRKRRLGESPSQAGRPRQG